VPITAVQGLGGQGSTVVAEPVLMGYGSRPSPLRLQLPRHHPGGAWATRPSSWPCCWRPAPRALGGSNPGLQRPGRRHLDFAGSGLWPARNCCRPALVSLAGGACCFAGFGLKLRSMPRRWEEGARLSRKAKEGPRAGEQGRRTARSDWAAGQVIARELRAGVLASWGSAPSFATSPLATQPRPSLSPACWPAPLAGHGL